MFILGICKGKFPPSCIRISFDVLSSEKKVFYDLDLAVNTGSFKHFKYLWFRYMLSSLREKFFILFRYNNNWDLKHQLLFFMAIYLLP